MFFDIVKCKKCKCAMHPNFDESIKAYMENEYRNDSNLVLPTETPPVVPDYVILVCESRECRDSQKMTFKDFFDQLVAFWADLAFKKSQLETRDAFSLEGHFSKYLIDRVTKKVITKKDLEGNLLLKELFDETEKDV
jgi:hypothetical protein